jgi:ribulose-phosphate 3-epimerase
MRELSIEIVPAILPKTFDELTEHLARLLDIVRSVQIDVCDGVFVPSKTWPYDQKSSKENDEIFRKILAGDLGLPYWEDFDFEVDLMVTNPAQVMEDWITAGASRIVIHEASVEDKDELAHLIIKTKAEGRVTIGLAITSETDLDTLDPYVSELDFIQCMGILRVGFQGEPLDKAILSTLSVLSERYPELILSVDGGVTLETAPYLVNAGATRLVSGSTVFKSNDIHETIELLRGGIDYDNNEE